MRAFTVTFTIPTGYIGCGIEDTVFYTFDEDVSEEDINAEIESDFTNWVEDIIEDLRMSAEYDIEEDEEDEV